MRDFLSPILTLALKDILLEVRTKEIVSSVLLFAFLAVIIFNFAFDPTPEVVALVAPGIIWVAFTFAGVLGFNRSFILEKDKGSLDGLLLCPVSRDVIYLGKLAGSFLFMIVMEALLLPVFAVLYDFSLFIPELLLIAALATLGFAAVGTLFSAMAVNTRSRETMLPLLLLPVAIPVIIAAVVATRGILDGDSFGELGQWWQLLLAFDVIFLVLSSLLFGAVLEE
ncbi:MAG: heme exporter protein CcmB [Chloroflexi bacterium]|nr:heme exporter protein CcmB [Chloroflexota bacterium]